MTNFIVKMMDSSTLEITPDDFAKLKGKEGLVFIASVGRAINLNSVTQILPTQDYLSDRLEEKRKLKAGILHDGTHVIRSFGQWFLLNGDYNDSGNPLTHANPELYPEVARDCVASNQEFYLMEKLSPQERLKLILEGTREVRTEGQSDDQRLRLILENPEIMEGYEKNS
jgi:hypothetical protein